MPMLDSKSKRDHKVDPTTIIHRYEFHPETTRLKGPPDTVGNVSVDNYPIGGDPRQREKDRRMREIRSEEKVRRRQEKDFQRFAYYYKKTTSMK